MQTIIANGKYAEWKFCNSEFLATAKSKDWSRHMVASHLASHSPQCVCVCPGRAAVWGWEWTNVGWTEGTLVVTGWSPTAEDVEEAGGVRRELGEGAS